MSISAEELLAKVKSRLTDHSTKEYLQYLDDLSNGDDLLLSIKKTVEDNRISDQASIYTLCKAINYYFKKDAEKTQFTADSVPFTKVFNTLAIYEIEKLIIDLRKKYISLDNKQKQTNNEL